MSRIGKNPVIVPDGVTAEVSGQTVKVKGKLGELSLVVDENVGVKLESGEGGQKQLAFTPLSEDRT
ncbi:MAG: 50S ribosomal protein L6, partial [Micavibrio aeruginosavorus]|nr:50S ribosomal protein L6 [Micavibrio aeruginosavorus]